MNKKVSIAGTITAFAILCSPFIASAATLDRQLEVGMTGSDVSALQTFLAKDVSIYPEGLITGTFGPLTQATVIRFQTANEIPPVGRVGPMTLAAINAQMAVGVSTGTDVSAAVISNVSVSKLSSSASVSWNTNELARGVVYYSTTPLTASESLHGISITGPSSMTDTSFHTAQNVSLQGLRAATKYYFMIYVTDSSGNVSVTLPQNFTTAN